MISVTTLLILDFCLLIVNWCALNLNNRLVTQPNLKIVPHAKKILGINIKHIRYFSNFVFKKKPDNWVHQNAFPSKIQNIFWRRIKNGDSPRLVTES